MLLTKNKLIGIFLIMLGLIIAGIVIYRSAFYSPDSFIIPPSTATSSTAAGNITGTPATVSATRFPIRLIVPVANVNAAVQYVGIKADGSMANPSNFTDVAWYKPGTVPGEVGSAVIAGHVDNALALSGVFKHLDNVKVGDDVYVTRKDGVKLHFVVDNVVSYPYKEAPSRQIFTSSDGKAHLNLITCAGIWVQAEHSYTLRTVIYTTLAN